MASKGQSAMEYLMTYGWAILVVMVVGVAMWRLGIFNMGASSPTSTGFSTLKPFLATCDMKNSVRWDSTNGFICQFVNSAGTTVAIRNLTVMINTKTCFRMYADTNPTPQYFVARGCSDENNNCPQYMCWNTLAGAYPGPGDCANSGVIIPSGSHFIVESVSDNAFHINHPNEPCYDVKRGEPYDIFVDLEYDVPIGNIVARKHSVGTVHVTGSP